MDFYELQITVVYIRSLHDKSQFLPVQILHV